MKNYSNKRNLYNGQLCQIDCSKRNKVDRFECLKELNKQAQLIYNGYYINYEKRTK